MNINVPYISSTLDEMRREISVSYIRTQKGFTIDEVNEVVCRAAGVSVDETRNRSRLRRVALPRQITMAICRDGARHTFKNIADYFKKDHATVCYGVNSINNLSKHDGQTIGILNRILYSSNNIEINDAVQRLLQQNDG